jgi:glutathione synthase/RimK-type ligase-like ATP-grasp enzyme
MLHIVYSGKSRPSAEKLAQESEHINISRTNDGDINWGRARARTALNPDISKVTNKRRMREMFREHNVPMPELFTEQQVRDYVNGHTTGGPYMFIGRPDTHTKGRGLWKIRFRTDLDKAIRGTRKKKAATHFMEYVESDREYRVHVFKGKSIRISEKVFNDDKTYTTGKPGAIKLARVRNAAKLAVEAVGLDFGAVDILARGENNESVFVLEVNAAWTRRQYAKALR